ncbi:tripartite tricarboxylate transporter substrate binding protein [Verticiella sediminum]|uniref:Tripartite tricarboxylate transporter substrate binding protein n=1 Tax=Verticiella sediminum TaxID=1247510 RepID=A0A556AGK9_9BURK|nr:tripartite tricarboxylate transporter substrate binding protein [Verticiella sediminum]TSH92030.1 tripartite tricarboxylate transporter substrate binding protein [Verticiella sediminum]
MLRHFATLAAALACTLTLAAGAHAQTPPLTIVVGFAPGGGVDTLARSLGEALAKPLGRPVLVENRPGAGGTIAAGTVARAAPDGNTLLFADSSLLLAPHVFDKVSYDLQKSFAPVAVVGEAGLALAVPADSPAKSLQELLDMARKDPGRYTYASVGIGSMHHLSGELLKMLSRIDLVHVPYNGGNPAVQALLGGHVDVSISGLQAVVPQAEAGRARILGVLAPQRYSGLPDVPAIGEVLPGFAALPTLFLLAPAGTPAASIAALEQALQQALSSPQLAETYQRQRAEVGFRPAAELATWLPMEEQRWVEVIQKSQLTFN